MIKIRTTLASLFFTLSLFTAHLVQANDPLPADEAFKFDAQVQGNTIQGRWVAEDDYYLYRDKIRFESGTPGFELGNPNYPKGKLKHGIRPDGTEGEVETYSQATIIDIPVTKSPGGEVTLIAHSQGCAESLGICYPPQKREIVLSLAATQDSAVAAVNDLSSALGLGSANQDSDPLRAEEAFKVSISLEGNNVVATWNIAPDYYIYRDKIKMSSQTPGLVLGDLESPKGE